MSRFYIRSSNALISHICMPLFEFPLHSMLVLHPARNQSLLQPDSRHCFVKINSRRHHSAVKIFPCTDAGRSTLECVLKIIINFYYIKSDGDCHKYGIDRTFSGIFCNIYDLPPARLPVTACAFPESRLRHNILKCQIPGNHIPPGPHPVQSERPHLPECLFRINAAGSSFLPPQPLQSFPLMPTGGKMPDRTVPCPAARLYNLL